MTYSKSSPVIAKGSAMVSTNVKAMTPTSHAKKKTAIRSTSTIVKKQAKKLSFKAIEIIELPITLGDNPSVHDGPPVSCGWGCSPQLRVFVDVDLFEQLRHGQRRARLQDLILSKSIRERLLQQQGFSDADILQATINAKKIKVERLLSRVLLSEGEMPMIVPPTLPEPQPSQEPNVCSSDQFP